MEAPRSTRQSTARKRRFLSPTTDHALSPASKMLLVDSNCKRVTKKDTARLLWGNIQKKLEVTEAEFTKPSSLQHDSAALAEPSNTKPLLQQTSCSMNAEAVPATISTTTVNGAPSMTKKSQRSTSPFEIGAQAQYQTPTDENAGAPLKKKSKAVLRVAKPHQKTVKAVKKAAMPKRPLGTRSVNLV